MKQKDALPQSAANKSLNWLYKAISAIETPKEAQAFFEDLCTPAELQAMADRWLVVKPLSENVPYRKIAEDTGVSVTTIGRVARCLQFGKQGYNTIYNRIRKNAK